MGCVPDHVPDWHCRIGVSMMLYPASHVYCTIEPDSVPFPLFTFMVPLAMLPNGEQDEAAVK